MALKTIITFIIGALILIGLGTLASKFPIEITICGGVVALGVVGYWVWSLENKNS